MKLFDKIKNSKLIKNLGIVLGENVLTKGMNFVIIIFIARILGPSDYGKYSFLFITITLLCALLDFGSDNTAIRFSGKYPEKQERIFGLYFSIKLSIIILFSVFMYIIGDDNLVKLNLGQIIAYKKIIIAGFAAESFLLLNDTYLQVKGKYKFRALINISRYLSALGFICILFLSNKFVLDYVIYIFFIPFVLAIFLIIKFIPLLTQFIRLGMEKDLLKEIFNYQSWMIINSIFVNILFRLDILMVTFLLDFQQVGIYNAAYQLASVALILPYAMTKVLLPKVSSMTHNEIENFIKIVKKPIVYLSLTMIAAIPFSNLVIHQFFGEKYQQSGSVLQLLLLSFVFLFAELPFEQVLYAKGKVNYIVLGSGFQILLIILVSFLLVSHFGIYAAAIASVIAKLLYLIYAIIIFRYIISKSTKNNLKGELIHEV